MPDCILKIAPQDPLYMISEPLLKKSRDFLEENIYCDSIEVQCCTTPIFVDCGSNLEHIVCPNCHSELSFDWWGDAMDKAGKSGFTSLETMLPCCRLTVSLNDLEYHFPCGFVCCVIEILNPICDSEDDIIDSIQRILGINVRIIKAHI